MRGPIAFIRGTRHPEGFHGHGVRRGYFEGWYVKLVDARQEARWALIPGVFRGRDGADVTDEAFVQVLDGATGRSWYHRYDASEFDARADCFDVTVGPNRFTAEGISINLPGLSGRVNFTTEFDPWPNTWRRPGIMGPYSWVPLMECYHGIVSFGHSLSGVIDVEGNKTDFVGGRGYVEKDWGRAFPAGYVWMHSNHIEQDSSASLIASVAMIPWMRTAFRGFIVGLKHGGNLYQWATYNKSRETNLRIDDSRVSWQLSGPDGVLTLEAERVRGGLLHAPLRTAMHQRVEETLDAVVHIQHVRDGQVLLDSRGVCAGMEVFGDVDGLLATKTK